MSTWSELRERRLIQIVLGYLVLALGTLELLNLFVERGVVPEWVWTAVLVLTLFGVPASLIVGWYHGEKGAQRVTRTEAGLLGITTVAAFATSGWVAIGTLAGSGTEVAPDELRDLAVLYYEAPDSTLRPVADGVTEGLIERLRSVPALHVVSSNAVRPFRGRSTSIDSIGGTLGVGAVIEGTVERSRDGRVQVTTSLREARGGGLIERSTIALPEAEVLALVDSVSEEISRILRRNLGEEVRTRRERASTRSSAAWLLLQRGRAEWKAAEEIAEQDPEAARESLRRADSLLAEAARADTTWLRPHLERSRIAYWESYDSRVRGDLASIGAATDRSLEHVTRVLERDPSHAEALAIRGTARYWRQLLPLDEPGTRRRLRGEARADLERAVDLDPGLAGAHSTLSHLYYVEESRAQAIMAAQAALEADAYLSDAANVMWRLFLAAYDLEMFPPAVRWCDEGTRRFSGDHRFALCRLLLMTAPAEPDTERAWELAARVDSLLPHAEEMPEHYFARLLVGGILGRAGLTDSAHAVLDRSRPPASLDPERELLSVEAFMWKLVGDEDRTVRLLQQYAAANPDHRFERDGERSWWWRGLEDHPDFPSLIRGP